MENPKANYGMSAVDGKLQVGDLFYLKKVDQSTRPKV